VLLAAVAPAVLAGRETLTGPQGEDGGTRA